MLSTVTITHAKESTKFDQSRAALRDLIQQTFKDETFSFHRTPTFTTIQRDTLKTPEDAPSLCILNHTSCREFEEKLIQRLKTLNDNDLLSNPLPLLVPWEADAPRAEKTECRVSEYCYRKDEQALLLHKAGMDYLQPAYFHPTRLGSFDSFQSMDFTTSPVRFRGLQKRLGLLLEQGPVMLVWHNGCARIDQKSKDLSITISQTIPVNNWRFESDDSNYDNRPLSTHHPKNLSELCLILSRYQVVIDHDKYHRKLARLRFTRTIDEISQLGSFDVYLKPVMDAGGRGIVRIIGDSNGIRCNFPNKNLESEYYGILVRTIDHSKPFSEIVSRLTIDAGNGGYYIAQEALKPALLSGQRFEPRLYFAGGKNYERLLSWGAKLGEDETAGNVGQGGQAIAVNSGVKSLFQEKFPQLRESELMKLSDMALKDLLSVAGDVAKVFNNQRDTTSRSIDYICLDFAPEWSGNKLVWKFLEMNPYGHPAAAAVDTPARYKRTLELYEKHRF